VLFPAGNAQQRVDSYLQNSDSSEDKFIRLYTGNAFDMTGERSRTKYRAGFNATWRTCRDKAIEKTQRAKERVLDSCDTRAPGRPEFLARRSSTNR
jgi:hypothetical protein